MSFPPALRPAITSWSCKKTVSQGAASVFHLESRSTVCFVLMSHHALIVQFWNAGFWRGCGREHLHWNAARSKVDAGSGRCMCSCKSSWSMAGASQTPHHNILLPAMLRLRSTKLHALVHLQIPIGGGGGGGGACAPLCFCDMGLFCRGSRLIVASELYACVICFYSVVCNEDEP